MDDKPARTMPRQPDVDEAAPRRETAHDSQTREPAAAAATTDDTLRYHNVDSDTDEEWHLLDLNDEEEEWQLLDLMDDLATERHLDTDESTSDIRVVAGRDTAPPVPQGEKRRPLLDLMAELGMERVVELPSATQTQEAGNGAPGPRVVLWRKRADAGAIDAPTIAQVLARRYPTAPAAWLELRAAHAHDHARARAQSEHGEQLASSVPDSDIPAQERTQQRLEIASPQQDTRGPRIVCWPRLDAIGSTSLANPAASSSQPDSLSEELNALDIKTQPLSMLSYAEVAASLSLSQKSPGKLSKPNICNRKRMATEDDVLNACLSDPKDSAGWQTASPLQPAVPLRPTLGSRGVRGGATFGLLSARDRKIILDIEATGVSVINVIGELTDSVY
ncbi:uncharacterized protein EHS24_002291 [Apiotrichum porosum]|uniref:Uncharacterized protein n=1 Tax=Apiotrichum porosum TaxID=105984 RepID=A0A427XII1_9TREE|nr:uncharacterized protein EHS24_002291 [Apiotrichum porosum]RSH78564.1 hypothetical protein EHS24_002291 [Apiotrichum porosum]